MGKARERLLSGVAYGVIAAMIRCRIVTIGQSGGQIAQVLARGNHHG
jgi:hypothetical protein